MNEWNLRLIHDNFNATEAKEIISMPRRTALGEDQMIWDLSRDGSYSVKSVYYYAMEALADTSHLRVDGN